jgi:hypothetical protein
MSEIWTFISNMIRLIGIFLLTTTVCLAAGIDIDDMKSAESLRLKTLQKLHVAQAPLHTKQDKASIEEINAYVAAAKESAALQKWVASNKHCSIILNGTGNSSNDPLNRRKYSKLIWEIHDAEIKDTPPFTRKDIGVAVKAMNDIRELFMLPVMVSTYNSMPDRQ